MQNAFSHLAPGTAIRAVLAGHEESCHGNPIVLGTDTRSSGDDVHFEELLEVMVQRHKDRCLERDEHSFSGRIYLVEIPLVGLTDGLPYGEYVQSLDLDGGQSHTYDRVHTYTKLSEAFPHEVRDYRHAAVVLFTFQEGATATGKKRSRTLSGENRSHKKRPKQWASTSRSEGSKIYIVGNNDVAPILSVPNPRFEALRDISGVFIVDKSRFIPEMDRYMLGLFLRPPGFGSTHLLSLNAAYHDIHHKDSFNELFAGTDILASTHERHYEHSQHLVMFIDLKGIPEIRDHQDLSWWVNTSVNNECEAFLDKYADLLQLPPPKVPLWDPRSKSQ